MVVFSVGFTALVGIEAARGATGALLRARVAGEALRESVLECCAVLVGLMDFVDVLAVGLVVILVDSFDVVGGVALVLTFAAGFDEALAVFGIGFGAALPTAFLAATAFCGVANGLVVFLIATGLGFDGVAAFLDGVLGLATVAVDFTAVPTGFFAGLFGAKVFTAAGLPAAFAGTVFSLGLEAASIFFVGRAAAEAAIFKVLRF
jgi:hypothetical protein